MNKTNLIEYALVIFFLIGWNQKIIPTRREISDVEPVKVIGMDFDSENKKNVRLSIIRPQIKATGSKEGGEQEKKQEIISLASTTFVKCIKNLQILTNKQFTGGHVKYIVLGEDVAKESLKDAVDFAAHDQELRLTSKVYIAREGKAKPILTESCKEDYELADKMTNMESSIEGLSLYTPKEMTDVLKLIVKKGGAGLIPSLRIIDASNEEHPISSKQEKYIDFAGYAVIKDGKLVTYLEPNESRGVGFIKNEIKTAPVDITTTSGDIVNLTINISITDVSFSFENDELKEIIISTNIGSDFTEITGKQNVFEKEEIEHLEKEESKFIKKEMDKAILIAQMNNTDFFNFEGMLNFKHPYKYHKIKDRWEEIFPYVKISTKVNSRIFRAYDVINPKEGEEE